ncbi:MAG: T9SS type A sorting domain-containing protein, partial [Bacteroidales bacterium]|nr:T9SS type A sorting domain-containing protein [Bacteroidales bacterium]
VDLLNTDAFSFGQGSFSISYWFNTASDKIYMSVIMNGCGAWAPGILCGLNWDIGRVILCVGADGSFNTTNCIGICTDDTWLDGQWHHVVSIVNKEANRALIYVDGEKQALVKYDVFGPTGGTFVNNDTELDITGIDYLADASESTTLIGNTPYGQFFDGAVDEVRVYDRALTEQEVNLLFTGSATVGKNIIPADFSIYPNPVSNSIYFNLKSDEISRIEIHDMFGRLILKQQTVSKNSLHQIDVSELSSGLYLLNIYSNEKIYVHKFQKKQ